MITLGTTLLGTALGTALVTTLGATLRTALGTARGATLAFTGAGTTSEAALTLAAAAGTTGFLTLLALLFLGRRRADVLALPLSLPLTWAARILVFSGVLNIPILRNGLVDALALLLLALALGATKTTLALALSRAAGILGIHRLFTLDAIVVNLVPSDHLVLALALPLLLALALGTAEATLTLALSRTAGVLVVSGFGTLLEVLVLGNRLVDALALLLLALALGAAKAALALALSRAAGVIGVCSLLALGNINNVLGSVVAGSEL